MLSKKLLLIEITAGLPIGKGGGQIERYSNTTMRLPTISLLLLIAASSSSKTSTISCDAFQSSSLSIISHHHLHHRKATTTATTTTTALSSSSNDNNDDSGWYDDYDDFVQKLDFENDSGWDSGADVPFDGSDNAGNSRRGRGGGRGGRGRGGGGRGNFNRGNYGGGGVGHDYQRDPNDFGSVDEGVVNDLLSQRLQFRKRKMFDEADDIRDELLNVHGVTM